MKGKQPAFQFYTGDWLKDPLLSLCTPATRGVWIDLLCAMHEAGRVGKLRGTIEQLARIARCSPADFVQAKTDLQTTGAAGVTERNGIVTVSNRRMMRERNERSAAALRQSRSRSKKACHAFVTPPSSSSTSVSAAAQRSAGARAAPTGDDPTWGNCAPAARRVLSASGQDLYLSAQTPAFAHLCELVGCFGESRVTLALQKASAKRKFGPRAISYARGICESEQGAADAASESISERVRRISQRMEETA